MNNERRNDMTTTNTSTPSETPVSQGEHGNQAVLRAILAQFPRTTGRLARIGSGKPYLQIETDHVKAERIGQWTLKMFPQQVQTYFACHEFRKAHLSIYFK